ncbi:hypothetical protein DPQ33_13895 [Oceanidesulfovibrio indonesiensis]|uniref:Rubrerythrin n=1 Tax=Oceanidesulfovibrio indonesiensis TaxID=54767 RepID=A0A7M3MBU9_9BACT|nr:hypothetical protein [Oceanidesulfovibrio indonesiensis]TVM15792.1 hypothetical protein DPQ33_13895 [Oceanidesulfovibrio indonesiensis]
MSESSREMLCQALGMVDKAIAFYDAHAESCEGGVIRDVFIRLRDLKKTRRDRLQELHDKVEAGVSFAEACESMEQETAEGANMFRDIARQHEPVACPLDEIASIDEAAAIELDLVRFFEDQEQAATEPAEKHFLHYLVQDARGQYMLINDMKWYYEDPGAWTFADKKPYEAD